MEAPSGVEPLIAALQTAPFTLGYGASLHMWWSQRDLNPCFRLEGRRPCRLDDGTVDHSVLLRGDDGCVNLDQPLGRRWEYLYFHDRTLSGASTPHRPSAPGSDADQGRR